MISEFSYYAFPALYFWWQKNLSIAIVAPKPNPKKREGKFSIQISRWALDQFNIQMFEIQSMFFLNSPQHFLPSKPLENQSKPFDGRKNQIMWKKRPDGKNANLLLFFTVDVLKIGSFLVHNISRAELSQAPSPWVKSSWVKLSWENPRWAESSCVKPRWVNYLSLYLSNIEKRQVYYGKNAHLNSNPEFPIALHSVFPTFLNWKDERERLVKLFK